ncbi:hypothetical protein D3C73_1080250 [compost metagenome]
MSAAPSSRSVVGRPTWAYHWVKSASMPSLRCSRSSCTSRPTATCKPCSAVATPPILGSPRVSACAMDKPPLSKPRPLMRIIASTTRSNAGVGWPVPAAATASTPSASSVRKQPSAISCAVSSGAPSYMFLPLLRWHCSASNFFDTASPKPARKKCTGAVAMMAVSTSTIVGLNNMCSTARRL